jgi:hypothetical protein
MFATHASKWKKATDVSLFLLPHSERVVIGEEMRHSNCVLGSKLLIREKDDDRADSQTISWSQPFLRHGSKNNFDHNEAASLFQLLNVSTVAFP